MPITENSTSTINSPITIKGEKIRSHMHRFNKEGVSSLSGYSVSINNSEQTWHSRKNTTATERNTAIEMAFKSENISIQSKSEENKNDKEITFYLPKEKGNFRSEITNYRPIKIDAESVYSFDFKATQLPKDLILFQVREMGGSMKTLGGDRPPLSLHIKQNGMLMATINTVKKDFVPTESNDKTYNNENVNLKRIELGQYHRIRVEMVMHRDNPSIKISVNDEVVFKHNAEFGASDSTVFYSKLGAYVPQQKNKDGSNDSEVSFDNIKETHFEYIPPVTKEDNNNSLDIINNDSSLEGAIASFNIEQSERQNVMVPAIENQMSILIAILSPKIFF